MKEWKEDKIGSFRLTRINPKLEPEKSGREKRREKRKLQRKNKS